MTEPSDAARESTTVRSRDADDAGDALSAPESAEWGRELATAAMRDGIPPSELDIALVRSPTGEYVVRIYSDELFLQALRRWDPVAHGGAGMRPFSADGPLPQSLTMDAVPAVRDWIEGRRETLGRAQIEAWPSREAHSQSHRAAEPTWLHRRDQADAAAGDLRADAPPPDVVDAGKDAVQAFPHHAPGGVELRVNENGSVVPVDRSGHVVQQHEVEYVGTDQPVASFDQAAIDRWARGEVPLGMPPEWWGDFRSELRQALVDDGVDPATVDVRLKGSAAEFFSGAHKSMPTRETLAADLAAGKITQEVHDAVLRVLESWHSRGGGVPVARIFDVMYRLGLDSERSDYDLNFSSDAMFRRALAVWDEGRHGPGGDPGGSGVPVAPDNHGYLNKRLVEEAFPKLERWAIRWSGRLGREISYAVFMSRGPDNTVVRHGGISVHYRETDWIIWKARRE